MKFLTRLMGAFEGVLLVATTLVLIAPFLSVHLPAKATPFDGVVERALAAFDQRTSREETLVA